MNLQIQDDKTVILVRRSTKRRCTSSSAANLPTTKCPNKSSSSPRCRKMRPERFWRRNWEN